MLFGRVLALLWLGEDTLSSLPSLATNSSAMGQNALWMRLRDISWETYESETLVAGKFPKLLQDIASRKSKRAMKACHELWQILCSGKLHPAAVAVLPILDEILLICSPEIADEIKSIMQSCQTLADESTPQHIEVLQYLSSR